MEPAGLTVCGCSSSLWALCRVVSQIVIQTLWKLLTIQSESLTIPVQIYYFGTCHVAGTDRSLVLSTKSMVIQVVDRVVGWCHRSCLWVLDVPHCAFLAISSVSSMAIKSWPEARSLYAPGRRRGAWPVGRYGKVGIQPVSCPRLSGRPEQWKSAERSARRDHSNGSEAASGALVYAGKPANSVAEKRFESTSASFHQASILT